MTEPKATEAGVEALVDRLHREGVEAGRQEAQRLIETARAEAEALLNAARAENERLLAETGREMEALRRSGEAALQLALRDTLLKIREALTVLLADRLGSRVRSALEEPPRIAELIVLAARRMTDAGTITAELGWGPDASDRLAALADTLCRDLAEGQPQLQIGGVRPGIVLRQDDGTLSVELTDETLTAFLFDQLQPRFRKIFEGARLD